MGLNVECFDMLRYATMAIIFHKCFHAFREQCCQIGLLVPDWGTFCLIRYRILQSATCYFLGYLEDFSGHV